MNNITISIFPGSPCVFKNIRYQFRHLPQLQLEAYNQNWVLLLASVEKHKRISTAVGKAISSESSEYQDQVMNSASRRKKARAKFLFFMKESKDSVNSSQFQNIKTQWTNHVSHLLLTI